MGDEKIVKKKLTIFSVEFVWGGGIFINFSLLIKINDFCKKN